MSLQPIQFRVTEFTKGGGVLEQLRGNLAGLAASERRISSGQLHERPSDAPLAVRRLISWESWIERTGKYEKNIELASSRLSATESSLSEFSAVISQARDLALQQINASATDTTRADAAVEISSLIDEALALANRKFADRYLHGGSQVNRVPFERQGSTITFRGDESDSRIEVGAGQLFADSVNGARAFGGISSEVRGRVDLDPVVSADTGLADLNNGRGVTLGSIEIRDGSGGRAVVDLTGAKTIGDVMQRIDDSGFASAALSAARDGITVFRAGADLTVLEVGGGSAARDLGLMQSGAGPTLVGDDLDPVLRGTTPLSYLRGGVGLEGSGLVITNGDRSGTVSIPSGMTIEGLINAIHATGTGVVAELTEDGRGVTVRSRIAGAELRIAENGGSSAAELGLVVPASELTLDQLNGGIGVLDPDGSDFRITAGGVSFDVAIESATTLGEVVAAINDHPDNAGLVLADIPAGENRLRLTDLSGGSEALTVTPIDGSFTAAQLGIEGSAVGGVLTGSDLRPAGVRLDSAFDGLTLLHEGLIQSDEARIGRAIAALDRAEQLVLETRGEIGGQLQRLEISSRRVQMESLEMEELRSQEGDTDIAEAIVEFQRQQTIYQAALNTAANLLQQSLLDFLG